MKRKVVIARSPAVRGTTKQSDEVVARAKPVAISKGVRLDEKSQLQNKVRKTEV